MPEPEDKELEKLKPLLMVVRRACLLVADAIAKMFGLRTRE